MNKNNKGFTLIELMLVTSLIGIVIALGYAIFYFGNKSFNVQNDQAAAVATARYAMDYITREIRKAEPEKVEVDNVNNTLQVDGTSGVKIRLEDGALMKGSDEIVTGIETLTFNEDADGKLEIAIVIKKKNIPDYRLNSEIYLREGGP